MYFWYVWKTSNNAVPNRATIVGVPKLRFIFRLHLFHWNGVMSRGIIPMKNPAAMSTHIHALLPHSFTKSSQDFSAVSPTQSLTIKYSIIENIEQHWLQSQLSRACLTVYKYQLCRGMPLYSAAEFQKCFVREAHELHCSKVIYEINTRG